MFTARYGLYHYTQFRSAHKANSTIKLTFIAAPDGSAIDQTLRNERVLLKSLQRVYFSIRCCMNLLRRIVPRSAIMNKQWSSAHILCRHCGPITAHWTSRQLLVACRPYCLPAGTQRLYSSGYDMSQETSVYLLWCWYRSSKYYKINIS